MHSGIQNIVERSIHRDSVNSAAVSHCGVLIEFHMSFTEEGLCENEATAAILGAPMVAGEHLYPELQKAYIVIGSDSDY